MLITPPATDWSTLNVPDLRFHRKAVQTRIFGAEYGASPITSPFAAGGAPLPVPAAWFDFGPMTTDAATRAADRTSVDTTSAGVSQPGRTDFTGRNNTLQAAFQWMTLQNLAIFHQLPLSELVTTGTGGLVVTSLTEEQLPRSLYYKTLKLSLDTNTLSGFPIIWAEYWPRVQVTTIDNQKEGQADESGLLFNFTFSNRWDSIEGFATQKWVGGPGWGPLMITGVSEVQSVTITGGPTGGTFTLTLDGQTTSALAFNAPASTVQAALAALSTVGVGNVAVSGAPGGPFLVNFIGALASTNVDTLTTSGAGLTGGVNPAVVVATVTQGGS